MKKAGFILGFVMAAAIGQGPAWAGEAEAKALLAKKAAILGNFHTKAEKALVNSAQDKVFGEYFAASADAQKKDLKKKIDQLSLNVQANFQVEEMCLIDDKGREISRIVGKAIAPESDLSTEEADAEFFKPSFAKAPKQVFVSPVYMSADANKWVVAYVTPVTYNDKKVAILHYEHSLKEFQEMLDKDVPADTYVVALDKDGHMLSDSRKRPAIAKKGNSEQEKDYFQKISGAAAGAIKLGTEGTGSFQDGGAKFAVAFKPIQDWTLAVVEKQK